MGSHDAIDGVASAASPRISDRKRELGRWPRAVDHERAGGVLYNIVSSTVLGLFRFRFRARVFILLVLQSIWTSAGFGLAAPADRNQEFCSSRVWDRMDFLLQLCPMVVLNPGNVAGNDRMLGDVNRMRGELFFRITTLGIGSGARWVRFFLG